VQQLPKQPCCAEYDEIGQLMLFRIIELVGVREVVRRVGHALGPESGARHNLPGCVRFIGGRHDRRYVATVLCVGAQPGSTHCAPWAIVGNLWSDHCAVALLWPVSALVSYRRRAHDVSHTIVIIDCLVASKIGPVVPFPIGEKVQQRLQHVFHPLQLRQLAGVQHIFLGVEV